MSADSIPSWVPLAVASAIALLGTTFLVRPALMDADRMDERSTLLERDAAQRPIAEAALAAAVARRDLLLEELGSSAVSHGDHGIAELASTHALNVESASDDITHLSGRVRSAAVPEILGSLDRMQRSLVVSASFEDMDDGTIHVALVLRLPRERRIAGGAE